MYSSCEGKANSSLLFASRHFLLAIFPSIISASSRLDNLVGGKAEKYGTKFFRYLLLYLPWYSFLLFLSFLYVFIRSILFFFSLFLSVSVFPHCCDCIYDRVYLSHYKRGQSLRAPDVESKGFLDNRHHTKVASLSSLRIGRLHHRGYPWYC